MKSHSILDIPCCDANYQLSDQAELTFERFGWEKHFGPGPRFVFPLRAHVNHFIAPSHASGAC